VITHWIAWDEPEIGRGRQQAACGAIVDSTTHHNDPSCHFCQDVIASWDETIDQLRAIPPETGREPRKMH